MQLEREYILQCELGFTPDYEPNEVFDPEDTTNYQGPPLPSRYQDLTLLNDWHLPGKEKRRKRRHRKTHGMIGFQKLSLKIAEAWKKIDPETRQYLSDLCDIGLGQYKVAMLAYKAAHDEDNKSITVDTLEDDQKKMAVFKPSIVPSNANFVPTDRCSMAEVDAAFEKDLNLSMENLYDSMSDLSAGSGDASLRSSLGSSFADSMVDLEDDDIIEMWKSTPVKTEYVETALEQGTVVSNYSSSTKFCQVINQAPKAEAVSTTSSSASFDPYGKNSYIDATLNDLKNMRNTILNQQIQMQSSIMAARRLTNGLTVKSRQHVQSNGMHGFAARSA